MKIFLFAFWLSVSLVACGQSAPSKKSISISDTIYTYATPSPDGTGKFYLGREISYVMGAGGASWLERAEREREEGTPIILKKLPIQSNSVVADIGAGTGYYSFRIAKLVPEGKVYAVELQNELINYLNRERKDKGAQNVTVVKGEEASPNLPKSSIDLAIMVDVYHELAYPHEMLQNILKALKPGGKLLLLEYKMEDPSIPIKTLHKMSLNQVDKEMKANGFLKGGYSGDLPIQHYLLYQKPGS